MRVSRETMHRHHEAIVAVAARMVRQHGIQGVSVSDVMQAAGLTHGGFYRHFASKEALVAETTTAIFADITARLEARPGRSAATALKQYAVDYLSVSHVEHPERGCPIAAYGADIAREGDSIKAAYTSGLERLLAEICKGLEGPDYRRLGRAIELLSLLSGAVVAARAAQSKPLTSDILKTARRRASEIIGSRV